MEASRGWNWNPFRLAPRRDHSAVTTKGSLAPWQAHWPGPQGRGTPRPAPQAPGALPQASAYLPTPPLLLAESQLKRGKNLLRKPGSVGRGHREGT